MQQEINQATMDVLPVSGEPDGETLSNVRSFVFTTPKGAEAVLLELGNSGQLQQIARVYKEAFGGAPWYEIGLCPNARCGAFYSTEESIGETCNCGSQIGEAYPEDWLVNTYIPEMIQKYVPGYLVLVTDGRSQVVGFMSGGYARLKSLIKAKYSTQQPADVLESICSVSELRPDSSVLYRNEEAVVPTMQGRGYGSSMSRGMNKIARSLGATAILMRTINRFWLASAERGAEGVGFSVNSFVPEGDNYKGPDDSERYLMVAELGMD